MLDLDNIIGHKMVMDERGIQKSRSFNFRKMFDIPIPGRQSHSLVLEKGTGRPAEHIDDRLQLRTNGGGGKSSSLLDAQQIGCVFNPSTDKAPVSRLSKDALRAGTPFSKDKQLSLGSFHRLISLFSSVCLIIIYICIYLHIRCLKRCFWFHSQTWNR